MKNKIMRGVILRITIVELLLVLFVGCVGISKSKESVAPGAPGKPSVWAYAGKTGIGTSYEKYADGQYSNEAETGKVSKVWFSLAKGVLTETMYGLIHESQIKDMQLLIVGDGFMDWESEDTESEISYLHTDETGRPLSLAYKIVNTDKEGKYIIEKHFFTNPDEDAMMVRMVVKSNEAVTPYLYLNPHVANTGSGDFARVDKKSMHAFEGDKHLTLISNKNFKQSSAGFVGVSDGISELEENGVIASVYNTTGDEAGNVATIAQLETETTYDITIGFGESAKASHDAASRTLTAGYDEVLSKYNGEGDHLGWEDYLNSLPALPQLQATSTDGGKLINASALVLKAQEDKTHAGALIASLSNPWGETASADNSGTGYKAVWPRDFYQCAMAFLAMGDHETPLTAFEYLPKVQVRENTPMNKGVTGWFMQKTHVDGTIEWISIQLDQTAMPIMLGWQLWNKGILSDKKAVEWYRTMLKPAADFLVDGGEVDMDWNKINIVPPATQQERWEEQPGYSPSTTAAVISGLVAASEFAKMAGDEVGASKYLAAADKYNGMVEKTMYTTSGKVGNGKYFIRVSGNDNPNDHLPVIANNGRPGMDETLIMDAGFLELVRYGVRGANAESIVESIEELDMPREENLQVKYMFEFDGQQYPGWRRYGNDGYGEGVETGENYGLKAPGHRGRVWPFFTGERAHYELAKEKENGAVDVDNLRNTYVKAMEYFANDGLMLPEQVWDGIGENIAGYETGEGTNSATPLAWTHAEYVKMLRSLSDQRVWDRYPIVEERYSK